MILDQITGVCAIQEGPRGVMPATATLSVDYKAPIATPGVVLARAWPTEVVGRKMWITAVIEDGEGKELASGKALYVFPRGSVL